MSDPVKQTVELGPQWPTIDPFLFCVHHDDAYPAGNDELGPDPALLAGRDIGQDFEGSDGWRMYHGSDGARLPAAPAPRLRDRHLRPPGHHRPLRLARRRPPASAGATSSGSPPARASCTPRCSRCSTREGPNPLELFQIWLNLPAADKMVDAALHHVLGRRHPAPRRRTPRAAREVTVIAGRLAGLRAAAAAAELLGGATPRPTSRSGTSSLDPGASLTLPTADGPETIRTLYFFGGASLRIAGHDGEASTGARAAVVDSRVDARPAAATASRCCCSRAARSASRSPSTARS